MCLAIPGVILNLQNETAEVDFSGIRRNVRMDLVPEAVKGDFVLVHAGFAIQKLDREEAEETWEVFSKIKTCL